MTGWIIGAIAVALFLILAIDRHAELDIERPLDPWTEEFLRTCEEERGSCPGNNPINLPFSPQIGFM
jgi:hypothetical protein